MAGDIKIMVSSAHGRPRGVFFVPQMKENARYEAIEEKDVPQNRNILEVELIQFNGLKAEENVPILSGGLGCIFPKRMKSWFFLTNNSDIGKKRLR